MTFEEWWETAPASGLPLDLLTAVKDLCGAAYYTGRTQVRDEIEEAKDDL